MAKNDQPKTEQPTLADQPKTEQPTLAEASGLKVRPPVSGPSISSKGGESLTKEQLAKAVKERLKVSGTFRLTEKYYRAGRLYEPGELVTIKDEVPGRSWEPFDPNAKVEALVPEALPSDEGPSLAEKDL